MIALPVSKLSIIRALKCSFMLKAEMGSFEGRGGFSKLVCVKEGVGAPNTNQGFITANHEGCHVLFTLRLNYPPVPP